MQNKWLKCILAALCVFLGFAISINLLGDKNKTYTVRSGDVFYAQPSVTAAVINNFLVGEELKVTDKIVLSKPTAAVMTKDFLLQDKDKTQYQLRSGAVYQVAEARLNKPNSPCVLAIETLKGQSVKIEVDKSLLHPIDEGEWLCVSNAKSNVKAWVRVQSKWY